MRLSLALALIGLASAGPSLAGNLILKNSSGQVLHTIPLQQSTPLLIGDMTTASQIRLQLDNGQGQVLHTVTLASAQPLAVLASGDMEAICATTVAADACDGLPSNQPSNLHTFTVSAPTPSGAPRPRISVGSNFRIEWASTGSDVCVSEAPAQLQNWAGQAQRAGSGIVANARFTALPTPNPASLNLRCYGAAGASLPRTIAIDVVP